MLVSLLLAGCAPADTNPLDTDVPDDTNDTEVATDPLVFGALLPETGGLAFAGPAAFASMNVAINEINAAGGVGGVPVEHVDRDSGDSESSTMSGARMLLDAGVDVVLGPITSGQTFGVLDTITGAGVLQISASNTSAYLTNAEDRGLYFRTAPSDVMQGGVLGDLVTSDGHFRVAILALAEGYGAVLADAAAARITAAGGTVVATVVYAHDDDDFRDEARAIADAAPEAVLVLGFDETSRSVPALIAAGAGPGDVAMYFVDGNLGRYDDLDAGALAGVQGTMPGADGGEAFVAAVLAEDPAVENLVFAVETYDAVVLVALAAVAAGSTDGAAMAAEMAGVSQVGTPCTGFAECVGRIEAGEDVDYQGLSGPISFTANGDIAEAMFGIYRYDTNNVPVLERFVAGSL